MIELDKIMKANELTLAVTAAFPAILVAATLGYTTLRLLSPPPPNVRTTAGPIRVAMAELERVRLHHPPPALPSPAVQPCPCQHPDPL